MIKQNVTEPTNDVVANLARDFPNDADKRMDAYLLHKIGSYLSSHALSIRLFDPKTFDGARKFNEAALGQLGFGFRQDNETESGELFEVAAVNFKGLSLLAIKFTKTRTDFW